MLVRDGDRVVSPAPLSASALEACRAEARASLAPVAPLLEYVERCGEGLAAIVTGRESALETLFPGGSFAATEYLYQEWPVARYFTGIGTAILRQWLQSRPAGPVRIIEVGAGMGSMTQALVAALPAAGVEYWYTDVSRFFLDHARQKFAAQPSFRYGLLDVERDAAEQGYGARAFDVVVASNVLHASADLDRALANVRSLLAPGGILLALEATEHLSVFDITTGLIEGWQRFADAWREDHPLLPATRWDAALRAAGFSDVAAFPEPGSAAEVLGQHVLLARVPETAAGTRRDPALPSLANGGEGGAATEGAPSTNGDGGLRVQLAQAVVGEREDMLVSYVRGHVARVLKLDATELHRRQRLMDLGLDSLMALEVRSAVAAGLGLAKGLPATLIFDYPTVEAIAGFLDHELFGNGNEGPQRNGGPGAEAADELSVAAARIEGLSEDDAEALLLQKLKGLRSAGGC